VYYRTSNLYVLTFISLLADLLIMQKLVPH